MNDWKEARIAQLERQRFLLQTKLKEIDTEVSKIRELQVLERPNILIKKRDDDDSIRDRATSR
jgi:hypothetical protein